MEENNFYLKTYNPANKKYEDTDHTALMVIDLQDKLNPAVFESDRVLENTVALLDLFKEFGLTTFATEQYPKGLGRSDERILERIDGENIFEKTSFNAITDQVRDFLKEKKIMNVVLVGAETHICVFQTAREFLSLGYNVFLVEDAVSSNTKAQKDLALFNISQMGVSLVNTEMVMYDLCSDSKNPHFKFMSKRVKELRETLRALN